jgi:DNA helicase-2/ATP-dependent DNA helicase PcrA|tara:strand:- start:980 stop:2470 length:1491 start_codon:yes stop_codon:yes gene_type:complete
MIRKILGPPGTGKTTKLLHYVRTFVKLGTPLNKIGYFAFTKKAAGEAKERMLENHPELSASDLKNNFKTLHSLAFWRLGYKKSEVMQDEHYEDIGKKLGIEVTVYNNGEETTGFVDSDSEYFNLINVARIKGITSEEEYNTDMYSADLDKNVIPILEDEINNYKDAFHLKDYTDMITKFNDSKLCPQYDVVFIDEAQDLSPIQWKMFDILKENSKHVILAGDDDQAIYGWAGADVKRFQDEPAKEIVLPKSYRVPKLIQHLANNILDRIPDDRRLEKEWNARDEEGTYSPITSIEDAPLHSGDWLILARYNDKLIKLKPILREMGLYFEYKERKSYRSRLYSAVRNYTRWTTGSLLSLMECKDLFEYFGKEFTATEERQYDLKEFGYSPIQKWYEVFETEPEDSLYIRTMLEKGEKLSLPARIKLSTIHTAKGGEATNVLLIMDNTKLIREAIERSPNKEDEENRIWYVGVTRTKQNLYIMAAKKEDKGYDIESIQ